MADDFNRRVHRGTEMLTHGNFSLIFSNIAILTNSSTLNLKIIVANLNSCVKMVFWGVSLWPLCRKKEFSFL